MRNGHLYDEKAQCGGGMRGTCPSLPISSKTTVHEGSDEVLSFNQEIPNNNNCTKKEEGGKKCPGARPITFRRSWHVLF